MWDTAPDDELLSVAASGAIHTDAGLKQQLTRLTASPRYEQGARAFFADMLQLDGFDNLVKDPAIYPKFNQSVADSAKEETLKSTVDLLINKKRDYRDLFTTTETIINRPLASVYNVPYLSQSEWAPYKFAASSERAGILTQVSFLSLSQIRARHRLRDAALSVGNLYVHAHARSTGRCGLFQVTTVNPALFAAAYSSMENTGCTTCHSAAIRRA